MSAEMHELIDFPQGGYRFIKGASIAYSMGVTALPGFRLERVRFRSPVPLEEAFRRIADVLASAKRPPSALAACELRSPAQFTEATFATFNQRYVSIVRSVGYPGITDINPLSRTNVCPSDYTLPDTCVYAFSYTVEDPAARPSFVLAGAVDFMDGEGDFRDLIVARDQVDAEGIKKKVSHALGDLEGRLSALGFDWSMITGNGVYCVHDIFQAVTEEIAARGAARAGTTWHLCRPPVSGLDFEMDIRSVSVERTI
jgi:hypothetical protein